MDAGHAEQEAILVAEVAVEYVYAGHGVHLAAPLKEYVNEGHE